MGKHLLPLFVKSEALVQYHCSMSLHGMLLKSEVSTDILAPVTAGANIHPNDAAVSANMCIRIAHHFASL